MRRKIVLASASPRRQELLAAAGIECEVMPSFIEERQGEREPAESFVCRVAREKAQDVLARLPDALSRTVLGADTVVVVEGKTLGKPKSNEEAAAMLRVLAGRTHHVLTGVCLLYSPASTATQATPTMVDIRIATTTVQFLPLSEMEIEEYVATGEPFDKAGGYGIQGRASKFVESIAGCYFNVVGLPVSLVYQMLQDLGSSVK